MLNAISAVFDIRPSEWPRVLLLYCLGGLFLIGMTWGETISEALFLKQIGVQFLSVTFIADAAIGIVTIAVYTAFVDRIPNDKLAIGIFAIFVALIMTGRVLVGDGQNKIIYAYFYLLSHIVRDLFVLHWWTLVIGLYDTRAAKRVAPFLSTAARPAGAIAGLSMPLLNSALAPENILILWALIVGLVAIGVYFMPRLLKDIKPGTVNSAAPRASYIQNLREGARFVRQSTFLRWMAVSTLFMTILFTLTNYQVSRILVTELGSVKAVSEFTGALTGWTNLIMLPIQLFFLSRIVSRFGLGNANLIFPINTLGFSAALVLAPSIGTAGTAYFNRTTFRTSFRITLDNLLYNAVPLRIKGRARAFIGGLVVPVGSLIGGLTLLSLPLLGGVTWLVPALILALAAAYMLSVFIIRKHYTEALIKMLEQQDFSFLLDSQGEISTPDQATLNWLTNKLNESTSPELTVFMAKLLADAGGKAAIPTLVQTARAGTPQIRAAILDTLVAADLRSDEVRKLFSDTLNDPDGRVRQSAIAGLKQGANQNSEQFLALALDLARDPSPEVQIEVLPTLVRTGDLYYMASAVQALTPILHNPDPRWRARGVEILGQTTDPRFIKNLLEFIVDPDDAVRLQAATGIESLSERGIPRMASALLSDQIGKLLIDPVERIRQAALTVVGRLNMPETPQILLSFLTDSSPQIREAAVIALSRMGKNAIPIVSSALESHDPTLRRMATVALSKIDREKSIELIRSYMQSNLTQVYANHVRLNALTEAGGYRSIQVLQSVLRERNQELLREIFYLLSALHNEKVVRLIADSLGNEDSRTRANALEAIESLSTPQIARQLGPIFDRELAPEKLLRYSQESSGIDASPQKLMGDMARDESDPWLRAIMVFALGEIGTRTYETAINKAESMASSEPSSPTSPDESAITGQETRSRNRRSRSSLDLLGTLTGDSKLDKSGDDARQIKIDRTPESAFTPAPQVHGGLQAMFSRDEIERIFALAETSSSEEVRHAASSARRLTSGKSVSEIFQTQGAIMLSAIEKIIFLKEVSFFEGMTVDQLKILASVAEEEVFNEDQVVFEEGAPGGALYVVVRGRVALEREAGSGRKGSMLRIGTVQAYSYFGEMTLFDNSPRAERALAVQDTLVLRLRREPLIALTRQYPELSLKLINVLSARLREANDRIAQLTTAKPRELHKVFDKLG